MGPWRVAAASGNYGPRLNASRVGVAEQMSNSRTKVVVIGGGLAGLASAVELSTRGLDVTIVDQNHHLGGKMNVLETEGFTFDMGPTILTMPQVIRGIISRTGRKVEDYIDIVDLDPQWRCFYDDGTVIDLRPGLDEMSTALDLQFPGQGVGAVVGKLVDGMEWDTLMMMDQLCHSRACGEAFVGLQEG